MKLWVLTHWQLSGDCETETLHGIFDSFEKAEEARKEKEKNWYPANNSWDIEEYELNVLRVAK